MEVYASCWNDKLMNGGRKTFACWKRPRKNKGGPGNKHAECGVERERERAMT